MTDPKLTAYLNWIKANGGSYKKIEFRDGCVYSTETITNHESFATMPFTICIHDGVARKALPQLTEFSGRVVLSVYLALQRTLGEGSFYWPYIDILPKDIKTSLYFTEEDFQLIKNTNLEAATRARSKELFEEFQKILSLLDEKTISWEDYLWSYSMVSSRSFPYRLVDKECKEGSEALFPLLDSLNHKPNTNITWSTQENAVSFISGQEFKAGEEVFNNYGPKSNEELLLGYGFCFEYNAYDYITLKPNFSQDPNSELKHAILKQSGIVSTNPNDPLSFYIHRDNIPEMFLKMMRVLVMNPMEVDYFKDCQESELLNCVGYRNELSMINMTLALLKHKQLALSTITETKNLHQTYALMYREGQKDVLSKTINTMEGLKNKVYQKMFKQKIASKAPFLSILSPDGFNTEEMMEEEPFLSLDRVVITLQNILNRDAAFGNLVAENFEDLEEEADIVMMLGLMHQNSKPNSPWRSFFDKVKESTPDHVDELQEMYEDVVPAFAEAYPDVIDLKEFSFDSFILADHIMNHYSIDQPFAIVPL